VGDGVRRYYFRLKRPYTENGRKRYRDIRAALGTSLERALQEAKRLDAQYEAERRGERPRQDLGLRAFAEWYVSDIRDRRRLLGWKTMRANVMVFAGHLGDIQLRKITRLDVERFLEWRRRTVRPTTVNSTLRDVKRMLNVGVEEGYLDASPAAKLKPVRAVPLPIQLPAAEEVGRVLDYLKAKRPWLYRIVLTLLCTGCRLGEAVALGWDGMDFARGIVTLPRRKVQDVHPVPMAQALKDELWALWAGAGMPKTGPVFVSAIGKPYTTDRVKRGFKPVAIRLGMPWLTLKTFRRLAATEAADATGDVRAAQSLLGHTDMRTTERYLGRRTEARERAVRAIEGFLDRAGGSFGGTRTRETQSVGTRDDGKTTS